MDSKKLILPPLKTLPAFIAVVKHESFSNAAKELHVTHSAVSQSIRQLEDFLGMKLFNRHPTKKISLTEQGKIYFLEINNALELITKATEFQLGITGNNVLMVNVMTTLTMRWLIPRLPDFQEQYPAIDLRLSSLTKEVDFKRDNLDLSIVYGMPQQWPSLYVKKLFDDKLILAGNAKLKLAKNNMQLKQLLKTQKAIYVDAELRKEDWKLWCQHAELLEPIKSNRIYFQSSSQALQAAVSGVGVMVSHEPFITDDLESGQLKLLSHSHLLLEKGFYLICPQEKLKLLKVRQFCDWLSETAK